MPLVWQWSTLCGLSWSWVGSSRAWWSCSFRVFDFRVSSGRTLLDHSAPQARTLSKTLSWLGYRSDSSDDGWWTRESSPRSRRHPQSSEDIFREKKCDCRSPDSARIRELGNLFLEFCDPKIHHQSPSLNEWLHRRVRYISSDLQGSQKAGHVIRRIHDRLCLYASNWYGGWSYRYLLPQIKIPLISQRDFCIL